MSGARDQLVAVPQKQMFFDAASMRGAGVLNKVTTCVICVPFRGPSSPSSSAAPSSFIASSSTASSASA